MIKSQILCFHTQFYLYLKILNKKLTIIFAYKFKLVIIIQINYPYLLSFILFCNSILTYILNLLILMNLFTLSTTPIISINTVQTSQHSKIIHRRQRN
jgi:hypothetical protein